MYIDTSCLVAYYVPEPKSDYVQETIQNLNRVSISSVTEIEMLSAIRKKQRMDELSEEHGFKAYDLFKTHIKNGLFEILELNASVFRASEYILRNSSLPLRTLDALHLGTAVEHKTSIFTFDDILLEAAGEIKIKAMK